MVISLSVSYCLVHQNDLRGQWREKDWGHLSTQLPFLHPAGLHSILPTASLFHFLTADLFFAAVQADKWISPCEECAQALWINVRIISLVWQCTLCYLTSSCESTNSCGNLIVPSIYSLLITDQRTVVNLTNRLLREEHFNWVTGHLGPAYQAFQVCTIITVAD